MERDFKITGTLTGRWSGAEPLLWPDGRPIETSRVFPGLAEIPGMPDWQWHVADWDLGDPCGSYFQTEADAIADARRAIAEQDPREG